MKILISGSRGLVGTELVSYFGTAGHSIVRLIREGAQTSETIVWDPQADVNDVHALEGFDAVVHLAGENIMGRWTAGKKQLIRDSRVAGTRSIASAIARCARKPAVLLVASAIGYYGDRGEDSLDESSAPGRGFLPEVCVEWEKAAQAAKIAAIRVIHLRFGVVLSRKGGALRQMMLPFQMGVGGRMGSGQQYMSWVSLEEIGPICSFLLEKRDLQGAVNVVTPDPIRNVDFTKSLGKALHRPTVASMPAFAARLAFGELADALLLSSARVYPQVLNKAGYRFRWSRLDETLTHLVKVSH